MFEYLEKLRRKPEGERRKAVLLISLGITLAIALLWLASLSFRIGSTDFSFGPNAAETERDMPSLSETFSNFIDQVSNIIGNVGTSESTTTEEVVNY